MVQVVPLADGSACTSSVAVRESTCTGNSVTERRHFSSTPPSASPAPKKIGYPFTAEKAEVVLE